MYRLELKDFSDKQLRRETEYLLTNGLGGYMSSTITGCHTRKYHGVLVASLNPPVERVMTVSKIIETITVENTEFCLNTSDETSDKGDETDCLKSFEKDYGVHFNYELADKFSFKKHQYLCQGENTALICYALQSAVSGSIRLKPELSIRDHHDVSSQKSPVPVWHEHNEHIRVEHTELPHGLTMGLWDTEGKPIADLVEITSVDQWAGPYYLANEAERGLQTVEYAYVPFEWKIPFNAGEKKVFYMWVTVEAELPNEKPMTMIDAIKAHYDGLLEKGRERCNSLSEPLEGVKDALVLAASNFIVKRRSTEKATILAGYPWFTDWGRDSMISLSGLTLSAGRPELFQEIYETFESFMKNGILPNVFPDKGDEPRYNTVDATLWMPIAMFRYYEETKDLEYVKSHFLPTIRQIIHHYSQGTLNNTYMDTDGLIWSGNAETQLTWMDVKVNGWVVTPRHGKAVEINALWYNTLQIGYFFNIICDAPLLSEAEAWQTLGKKVKQSFLSTFWNESGGCLYDVVRGNERIDSIRPNQLFALSLPYPLLEEKYAQKVLEVVKLHLWMPYGLKSLSPTDANYHGYYGGDVLARDGAYHRGTGWGWLIGPYLDSVYYVEMATGKSEEAIMSSIEMMVLEAAKHLENICLGQICENFDGDAPFHGRGCMAQAWSVSELLRWVAKINDYRLRRATS